MTALHLFEPNTPFGSLLRREIDPFLREGRGRSSAPASIFESEDGFQLVLEAPGLSHADLDIKIEKNHLIVSGEKKAPEVGDGRFLINERSFGGFSRAFKLSDTINQDAIEAGFENGVLTVVLPKVPEVQPKSVKVNAKAPESVLVKPIKTEVETDA